jgi:hypothetical protein
MALRQTQETIQNEIPDCAPWLEYLLGAGAAAAW